MEEKTVDNLDKGLAFWNSGDIATLLGWFAEDVAYCSPMISDGGSRWVEGLEELATHMLALPKIFPRLDLADTLCESARHLTP